MCTGCVIDDIVVCPSCKRDDEGYKLAESDSPFTSLCDGMMKCLCGNIFTLAADEKSPHSGTAIHCDGS